MISHKHKTIFVHIPKAAGQSIETMFLNDLGLSWAQRNQILLRPKRLFEKGPYRLAHLKADQYLKFEYSTPEEFNEFFKFSFVRNPYSRAYSLFKYLGYAQVCSFKFFAAEILGKKIRNGHYFFASQTDYLFDSKGNLLVDFVGKFESLSTDIEYVTIKSKINNKSLPFVNKSESEFRLGVFKDFLYPIMVSKINFRNRICKNYQDAYCSETKQIISRLYEDDFKNFGYEHHIK